MREITSLNQANGSTPDLLQEATKLPRTSRVMRCAAFRRSQSALRGRKTVGTAWEVRNPQDTPQAMPTTV